MSVLMLGGRPFAAGLYWVEHRNWLGLVRTARTLHRWFYCHWGNQTGFGGAEPESPDGVPSLAAALAAHIEADSWLALVQGEERGFALVRMHDRVLVPGKGDQLYESRASALEAFETAARDKEFRRYATEGLVADAEELDPSKLVAEDGMLLRRVPLGRLLGSLRKLAALSVVAAAVVGWWQQDALWELVFGPEQIEEPVEQVKYVFASVDSGGLVDGCRRAMARFPPYMPAWELAEVSCTARFRDDVATVVKPELSGRAVMMVRWRLPGEHDEALHRQVAEGHLGTWYIAVVAGRQAWAVVPLKPVLRLAPGSLPTFLELRRTVDRRLGPQGVAIRYEDIQAGSGAVRLRTGHPLTRVSELIEGIAGLEIVKLSRKGQDDWEIEARRARPAELMEPRFLVLTREVDDGRWS